ncbi:MAG: GNAT family N-acetyltransferase [Defluviitaleaceae bacterium]|nr:GNAT family N-acetyltransferase [Defluviitaleaceae bacterium]
MLKLQGERIYLAALEREDCKTLLENLEHDFGNPMETLDLGFSLENYDEWFEKVQKRLKGGTHVNLGIFLNDDIIIGDVALQRIDKTNRSCTLGMGFAKVEHRNQGYGTEAASLMLKYGFYNLGLERIWATTLEHNILAQKMMEKLGFRLEGIKRKAVYFCGKYIDEYHYGLLKEELIWQK